MPAIPSMQTMATVVPGLGVQMFPQMIPQVPQMVPQMVPPNLQAMPQMAMPVTGMVPMMQMAMMQNMAVMHMGQHGCTWHACLGGCAWCQQRMP